MTPVDVQLAVWLSGYYRRSFVVHRGGRALVVVKR